MLGHHLLGTQIKESIDENAKIPSSREKISNLKLAREKFVTSLSNKAKKSLSNKPKKSCPKLTRKSA